MDQEGWLGSLGFGMSCLVGLVKLGWSGWVGQVGLAGFGRVVWSIE